MTYYEQASSFFAALTGTPTPEIVFQTFCDPDLPADWPKNDQGKTIDLLAEHWHSRFDAACVEKLFAKQRNGAGVFFCINGSSSGGRTQKEIDQFRTMVVDSDGAPYPASWPYPPHAIVERDATHWHAYWFIDGNTDRDSWSFSQYQLGLYFGGDLAMVNADRVCRIPGFIHQKNTANPMEYKLIYLAPTQQRYNLPQLMSGFQLECEKATALLTWWQKRSGKSDITLADYDDAPVNANKYLEYLLQRSEPSIQGQGGNSVAFKTACAGRDYGLSPDLTLEMMLAHWNDGCIPPWTDGELEGVVTNAYRYSANSLGTRSIKAFLDQPYQLPPGASVEPVHAVVYDTTPQLALGKPPKIDPLLGDSVAMHGEGFNKNHTNNAAMFLKYHAPNKEMFVHNEETYRFNGKAYDKIDPPTLEYMVFSAIEHMMPSRADLSGALGLVKTKLVGNSLGVKKLPAWRDDPTRSVSSIVAFKNCILNIETNERMDHTPELLTTNVLEYDYAPEAQCPQWLQFLHNLWGDDAAMLECFQQWVGYCMVHDYSHQKIATLIGKPRSGKGTIGRVLNQLLGEFNVASPTLSTLADAEQLHAMSDKLIAIVPDAGSVSGPTKDTVMEHLKSISGNDKVSFDRKYLPVVSQTISARLIIMANEFPYFNDPSGAIVDRILYFPFRVSHAGSEDTTLEGRLLTELPGIANWAIQGLRSLRAQGRFTESSATHHQKTLLRRQLSPALSFSGEMLYIKNGVFLTEHQIYQRYMGWVQATGMFRMNRDQLMRALESALNGAYRHYDSTGAEGFMNLAFKATGNAPDAGVAA